MKLKGGESNQGTGSRVPRISQLLCMTRNYDHSPFEQIILIRKFLLLLLFMLRIMSLFVYILLKVVYLMELKL